jgi:hypothetical protein
VGLVRFIPERGRRAVYFRRLKNFLRKPVAWGAVLLSYVGIIAAVGYAANVGAVNGSAVRAEAARADSQIVKAAEVVIRDGCEFDNKRAGELRGILERSLENQKLLAKEGVLPPSVARHNIEETQKSIKAISHRDCDLAVSRFRHTTEEK